MRTPETMPVDKGKKNQQTRPQANTEIIRISKSVGKEW